MGPPMEKAMVYHITEGELQSDQEGKPFTAKKNFVWTCTKNTKEQACKQCGRNYADHRPNGLRPAEAALAVRQPRSPRFRRGRRRLPVTAGASGRGEMRSKPFLFGSATERTQPGTRLASVR